MPRKQGEEPAIGDNAPTVAADQMRSFIERVERLEEGKREILDDIKEVYGEAKANGLDVSILRMVVRRRKLSADERAEVDAMLDLYEASLGVFG